MMLKVVEVVGEERDEAGIDVQSGAEYLGEAGRWWLRPHLLTRHLHNTPAQQIEPDRPTRGAGKGGKGGQTVHSSALCLVVSES